jgi:hypothetical protein
VNVLTISVTPSGTLLTKFSGLACAKISLAAKNFISHIEIIYDTTPAHVLAGIQCIRIGRVCWPTALHIGRTTRSCYKEGALEHSLADEKPESVAITPIGAAQARLPSPLRCSHESDPVV